MSHPSLRPSPWRWLALAALALTGSVQADSYLYITNSTNETVQVRVNHYGDDTLAEGSEWRQETQEIAPYATARVLAFNRYEGLKSGKTYRLIEELERALEEEGINPAGVIGTTFADSSTRSSRVAAISWSRRSRSRSICGSSSANSLNSTGVMSRSAAISRKMSPPET